MATIKIPDSCLKTLDDFFAKRTIQDVNRDTFLICNLHDNTNKIVTSLVFLRDWDSLETDSFNQVIIENKGVVFTFPCYWVSIPKELSMEYFTYILNTFYEEYVSKWISSNTSNSSNIGNNGSTNNGFINGGCNCTPPCNFI